MVYSRRFVGSTGQDSVLPGFVSVRETVVYTACALTGVVLSQQIRGTESAPSLGIVVGAVVGVNVAGYIGRRRGWQNRDGVTDEILDNAMIYGFVFFAGTIALGLTTSLSFTTAQELVAGTSGLVLGMVVESLRRSDYV